MAKSYVVTVRTEINQPEDNMGAFSIHDVVSVATTPEIAKEHIRKVIEYIKGGERKIEYLRNDDWWFLVVSNCAGITYYVKAIELENDELSIDRD